MTFTGDADLNYYPQVIKRLYPQVGIVKQFAECKNNVLEIYKLINWSRYPKDRVFFFVDRDLSFWCNEPQSIDVNVYITDGYSFENDAVNIKSFMECAEDIYGFANASQLEKKKISDSFSEGIKAFCDGSKYIMGALVVSYKKNRVHLASQIKINKIVEFNGPVFWKTDIESTEYILETLRLEVSDNNEIQSMISEFDTNPNHFCVRGKWALLFMVKLLDSILENGKLYAPSLYGSIEKEPKKLLDLSERGAMVVLGPKIDPPQSLISFVSENINAFLTRTGVMK